MLRLQDDTDNRGLGWVQLTEDQLIGLVGGPVGADADATGQRLPAQDRLAGAAEEMSDPQQAYTQAGFEPSRRERP